jgi:4-nitrophenyl phosphatase
MAPAFLSRREEYKGLIDKFDTFLFDCDGVIWHGDRLVPGAREVLYILRERSKSSLRRRTYTTIGQ